MLSERLYEYRRKQIVKHYMRLLDAEVGKNDARAVEAIQMQFQVELDALESKKEDAISFKVMRDARRFDIEVPIDDPASWRRIGLFRSTLSPSVRTRLRALIDAEKTRRSEAHAWWWKNIVLPAITAFIGLAGAITGIVAVLHSKK